MPGIALTADLSHTTEETQTAFWNLWGGGLLSQAAAPDYQHLRHLQAGDQTYDLADPNDMEKFLTDMGDGCLDGKAGERSADLNLQNNKLSILKENGDLITFDLTNPTDFMKLRRDSADGKIDGKQTSAAASKPASEKKPESVGDVKAESNGSSVDITTSQDPTKGAPNESNSTASTPGKDATAETHVADAIKLANELGPEGLMGAIRSGKLPPDIMNSPAAMQVINQRIMDYQTMITMMTNMMKAMHDLQMAIANNIR